MAIAATALGLVLLFSFKTPDGPAAASGPIAVSRATPAPITTSGSATPRSTQQGGIGGTSPSAAGSSPTGAPPAANGTQQVDGDVVSTRFGDVQVRIIEMAGKITDVQPLQLPFDRRRSDEISKYSAPILHDEALQAQSARIDTVSGATYTSDGYRTSLQSALDRVHG